MTALTEPKRVSEVVEREWDQLGTRMMGTFTNDTGAAAAFEIGTVCEGTVPNDGTAGTFNPADGTTFAGILLENIPELANGATADGKYPFLVLGPAVVNIDELEWDAGATQANVLAAMKALLISAVKNPASTETG
jgi:hypothetical protein